MPPNISAAAPTPPTHVYVVLDQGKRFVFRAVLHVTGTPTRVRRADAVHLLRQLTPEGVRRFKRMTDEAAERRLRKLRMLVQLQSGMIEDDVLDDLDGEGSADLVDPIDDLDEMDDEALVHDDDALDEESGVDARLAALHADNAEAEAIAAAQTAPVVPVASRADPATPAPTKPRTSAPRKAPTRPGKVARRRTPTAGPGIEA